MPSVFDVSTVAELVGWGFALGIGCFFLGQLIWIPCRVFGFVAKPASKVSDCGGDSFGD